MKEKTVFVLSLGCAKNRVDSERFLGVALSRGYRRVQRPEGAGLCVINTCGFLESAVRENLDSILEAEEMRRRGLIGSLAVVGCLVNRYGEDLKELEVDFLGPTECYREFGAFLDRGELESRITPGRAPMGDGEAVRYLKVAEGCSNRCSYCAIPMIRGPLRSSPVRELVAEAEELLDQGAKEICLVAQDLTRYGEDLGVGLMDLLGPLESTVAGRAKLRLLYLHPSRVTRELIERVASSPVIHSYLDVPVQHASPGILASMGRPMGFEDVVGVFKMARQVDPLFAMRTTLMVGYPGEGAEDFQMLLRFLDEAQPDRVGAFVFSPEEGTGAFHLAGRVGIRTAQARLKALMDRAAQVSLARQRLFEGRELEVLLEDIEDGMGVGRSYREAPEVDGSVLIPDGSGLMVGRTYRVLVDEALEHDLIGSVIEEV
ncbi:radical SAM methylthiotransferase, MiaB/RimO family [Thermanaerovibrio velox DSM 12556]|uniref:Radical SAM methylthiotransferase, MiaB/RimO family n=1 Tax=Thermanaerovibrio velox DSM 12556 TaxID=926567 RepID=H0UNE2_9BACT|nr:MiaB/RimO family radical SAM methylthiotransferase [Thermanaerovibrio velox]EHM09349.1 radical SAM methylthiotransferase, MiaB/RimO family [Thermanaerovibrio velox DSM 12556]